MSLFTLIKQLREEVNTLRQSLQDVSEDIRDIQSQLRSRDLGRKERQGLNEKLAQKKVLQQKLSDEFQTKKTRRDEVQQQIDEERAKPKPVPKAAAQSSASTPAASSSSSSSSADASTCADASSSASATTSSAAVDLGPKERVSEPEDLPAHEKFQLGELPCDEAVADFNEMGLPRSLLRGVLSIGFDKPTAIQQRAIRAVASGRDMVALAPSGTGKTGAFMIGALARVDPRVKRPQVIVLAPNRELIEQTTEFAQNICRFLGLEVFMAAGDTRIHEPVCAQVVVGTPAKVLTLATHRQALLSLRCLRTLVLDEADALVTDDEKVEHLKQFLRYIPKESQVAVFSATMEEKADEIVKKIAPGAVRIDVRTTQTLGGMKEFKVEVEAEQKVGVLCDLYPLFTRTKCIVFCKSIENVKFVVEKLTEAGHSNIALHSQLDPAARTEALKQFRESGKMLVTTDIIGRGIDIPQVAVVVNFDVPFNAETYIHRTGRSCRYGKIGSALTLVTNSEKDAARLKQIEEYRKAPITELPAEVETAFS